MDGWMDERLDEWMDRLKYKWMDGWIDGWKGTQPFNPSTLEVEGIVAGLTKGGWEKSQHLNVIASLNKSQTKKHLKSPMKINFISIFYFNLQRIYYLETIDNIKRYNINILIYNIKYINIIILYINI